MMAELFTMEVLLQVAATMERSQAFFCRQAFLADAEDALGGFTFDRNRVRKTWRYALLFELDVQGAFSAMETPTFLQSAKGSHGIDGCHLSFAFLVGRRSDEDEEGFNDSNTFYEVVILCLHLILFCDR